MKKLLDDIKACTICKGKLPHEPRPVVHVHPKSRLLIIGQAPGTKVHKSGIPWDDQSGKRLREWLGMDNETFYNEEIVGIVPMGFCYPGKGKSGDLPPRKECAPHWHEQLAAQMPEVKMTLLIGQYAQKYYLKEKDKKNLTETVLNFAEYLPEYFVLPHPSPRNGIWLKKHSWFEAEIVPELKNRIKALLKD